MPGFRLENNAPEMNKMEGFGLYSGASVEGPELGSCEHTS